MTESVMQDPMPENIDGQKIVQHRYEHGIDWQVNISHIMLGVAVIAAIYFYQTRIANSNSNQATVDNPTVIDMNGDRDRDRDS